MASHVDWVRKFCLSLPHTTEDIQWENVLLFRIARRIYCLVPLEPGAMGKIAFKCTPDKFAELIELEGIIPAPYMARNCWVSVVDLNVLRRAAIEELIENSYWLVRERLPKRVQESLYQQGRATGKKKGGIE